MNIPEKDYAEINKILADFSVFTYQDQGFPPAIVEQIQGIFDEACRLPEWNAQENYMNAGMGAVIVYLKETYPWMTEQAQYAIQHGCMMYMK